MIQIRISQEKEILKNELSSLKKIGPKQVEHSKKNLLNRRMVELIKFSEIKENFEFGSFCESGIYRLQGSREILAIKNCKNLCISIEKNIE